MPKKESGVRELLVEDLQDIYDAEKQLLRALPKMVKAAGNAELETAFREHLEETKGQVQRLEHVFQLMDARARSRPCRGMKGIVEESREHLAEDREPGLADAVLCEGGRKVEHYEIAAYESARSMAQTAGIKDAVQLLSQTLREETEMDRRLAQISRQLMKEMGSQEKSRRPQNNGRAAAAGRKSASGTRRKGHSAQPIIDREEIRRWAEERNAVPSCVKGTGGKQDIGMLRLNFPGYSGEESLQEISWDDWFEKFDERNLALMVQETTAQGQPSNFNKIVNRGTPKARAAR
jgi:ferritin-like metal-binding protein YciE